MEHLERKVYICDCHSIEHQVAFWWDEEEQELFCEPHLSTKRNFIQRTILAIKYIFGYKTKRGAWEEFIFKRQDLIELKKHIMNLEDQ